MAFQNRNFDFQGQVPMASIIQAYQNKAQQEYQMKLQQQQANRQKHQDVLDTIKMASGLVQQGVQLSKNRQDINTRRNIAELLAQQSQDVAIGKNPDGSLINKPFGETPQFKSALESEVAKAFPEMGLKLKLSEIYEDKNPLDNQIKQAQLAKYKAEAQAKSQGVELDSPSKIKAHILNKLRAGEQVSDVEQKIVAADLEDPAIGRAFQLINSNPINMTKSTDEKMNLMSGIIEDIRSWREAPAKESTIYVQLSNGKTGVIKAKDWAKVLKADPKAKKLGIKPAR